MFDYTFLILLDYKLYVFTQYFKDFAKDRFLWTENIKNPDKNDRSMPGVLFIDSVKGFSK